MKRITILILILTLCVSCGRYVGPGAPDPVAPKINARVLVYMPKVFGNDLLIYIQATFLSKDPFKTFTVKGTGKSSDDGVYAQTPDLGKKAFSEALLDLKENILEKRSSFETR